MPVRLWDTRDKCSHKARFDHPRNVNFPALKAVPQSSAPQLASTRAGGGDIVGSHSQASTDYEQMIGGVKNTVIG